MPPYHFAARVTAVLRDGSFGVRADAARRLDDTALKTRAQSSVSVGGTEITCANGDRKKSFMLNISTASRPSPIREGSNEELSKAGGSVGLVFLGATEGDEI